MSYNFTILSYNKNEEIEEYAPASSPSTSSIESNNENELRYHSFYIPSSMSLNEDNMLFSNTNLNIFKSYSASPLIINYNKPKNTINTNSLTNIYDSKTKKIFAQKKPNNNIKIDNNNNININNNNKMIKSMNINSINLISQKRPLKKKLLDSYSSYRNIYQNKKYSNKIKKMKTVSLRKKKEEKELKKEKEVSNTTIKNENLDNRIEVDKANKKINIYIKNNIYNYNLIHDVNNNKVNDLSESQSNITKSEIKVPSQQYFNKNNSNTTKKNNNKKPSIRVAPMDYTNNKNNNSTNNNIFLKEKEKNNHKNIITKNSNKNNFDFPFFDLSNNFSKPIIIQPIIDINYKKLLPKFHYIYREWRLYKDKNRIRDRINPIINILSFLNQKDIIEIIGSRNKKMMLLINKSLIDSYYTNIKRNLKRYNNYMEPIKSTLVYTYTKNRCSLKIDFMMTIRFFDKNKRITNPKHFQLLYLFEFLKDKNILKKKNKNKNRLYDCYGFDIIPETNKIENELKKEFKGVYLSKQMSRFNIDKNDELINIQPILPFKFDDRGIFNLEIFSNQNYFINPKNLRIKLNIFDLYSNSNINELRINEYDSICKYWKKKGGLNEKKMEIYKNIIKEWFEKYFVIQDIFYADIGLSVFKFNLIANCCGVLINDNLNVKIIIKEKDDYIENEIKKNNLLFERNNVFEIRKGENLIFFLSMY